jgi:hypothetical protein
VTESVAEYLVGRVYGNREKNVKYASEESSHEKFSYKSLLKMFAGIWQFEDRRHSNDLSKWS